MVTDFLIRLKNASMAKNKNVQTRLTKKTLAVAEALKKLGYLDEVKKNGTILNVTLAYRSKKPVLMNIKLVSKPGLRVYLGTDELAKKKGPTIFLVSTPSGLVSSREAVKRRIGGEVIAEIL